MLEPRYGCARAAGVGLPERSEPDGMARPQVASRSEVARGLPQGAARERIAKGLLYHGV